MLRSPSPPSIDDIDARVERARRHGLPVSASRVPGGARAHRLRGSGNGLGARPITLNDERGLAAAAPAYIKTHSYGEFVFDFAWAQAYSRHGRRYYPKLSSRCRSRRPPARACWCAPGSTARAVAKHLLEAIEDHAASRRLSSVHALFLDEPARAACEDAGWLLRRDCQFHWSNRGYPSFEAYLETFTAEKRKKARRERRRVAEAGIRFETRFGGDLDEHSLDRVYDLSPRAPSCGTATSRT